MINPQMHPAPTTDSTGNRVFWLEVRSAVAMIEAACNRRHRETKNLELAMMAKLAGAVKGVLSAYLVLE